MASPMAHLQNKKAGGSHHKISQINRHSLRNGVTAYTRPPRCPGLIATVPRGAWPGVDPSVGGSGQRDFAVRVRHVRLTCRPRPSHPRPTYRDDRPKRTSCQRRDARVDCCDLPDGASADACGRLARRAVWGEVGGNLSIDIGERGLQLLIFER
jgi:hypothetical protein